MSKSYPHTSPSTNTHAQRNARQDKAKTGTPLLVLAEGGKEGGPTFLHDSTLILEHLSGVAFPEEMGYLYPEDIKDKVRCDGRAAGLDCLMLPLFSALC